MVRTMGFPLFLALVVAGCAPAAESSSMKYAPIGPLADDYQARVKADFSRTLVHPDGAIFTFQPPPNVVNLGKRIGGVHYAWFVCGTVNEKDASGGYAGPKPFLSVLSHNVVIDREIDSSRARECGA